MKPTRFFPSARAEVHLRHGSSRSRLGDIHVVLPAKECLMQIVDVPTTDELELEGMMALRAEEVSPFPLDRTHWGWEVVSQTESGSRVFFVLTGHRLLDALHEEGTAHSVVPDRVDVDVLAWWTLISEADRREEAVSRLVLLVEADQSFLFALEAGVPAAVVSLGDPYDCDLEVYLEEMDLALAALEAERGALSFSDLSVWEPGGTPEGVDGSALQVHLGLPVSVKSFDTLPSLEEGVERRAVLSKSKRLVDLVPEVWKEEAQARALRLRLLKSALAVGGLWLLLVASFSGYVWSQERRLAGLEAEIAAKQGAVREVQTLSNRVRSLSQFTDRSTSALEILRMLAEASPGSGRLLIRDMQYRKDQGVTVSGEASGDFFVFQEMLSESPVLRVESFETREVRGQTEFRLASVWRWQEER